MDPKLAIGLATFIGGIATSLSTAQHGFADVLTPGFVSAALLQVAGFILAVWGGVNTKPPRNVESRTRADDSDAVQPPAVKDPEKKL